MCRSQGDYENKADGWLNDSTHPHHILFRVASNGSSVVVEKQMSILNSAGIMPSVWLPHQAEAAFHHIRQKLSFNFLKSSIL